MARFYVDEDVALLLAHSLSQAGHDALTTRDAGRLGAGDHLQFLYAVQERRILITHNVSDFSLLHLAWMAWPRDERAPQSHPGILVAAQEPAERVAAAIGGLLTRGGSLADSLYRWRPFDAWSRLEPDGNWLHGRQ
jgi:hypothetical protein